MDKTIIVSIIGGIALIATNIFTAIVTARQTTKREQKKNDAEFKFKIAEYAIEHPEKLLQIEKQLAIGILMVEDIDIRIRKYIIPNNRIQIGRNETCDIILDNPYISNEHCAIYSNSDKVYVEDLISTNGTLVNGEKIDSKVVLKDGDEIKIEDRIIKYKKLSS
jgi:pSer/pThr/pTyr-binding forkhead associated (FHA) protein